jgi:hypothetical protein
MHAERTSRYQWRNSRAPVFPPKGCGAWGGRRRRSRGDRQRRSPCRNQRDDAIHLMRMVFPSSVCGAVSQYNAAAAGGVSDFPDVLLTLFRGENTGKLVLALPTE